MTNFKGTKGKWVAKNIFGNWIVCYEKYDKELLLTIRDNQANALLISKAPEMLEMLEKVSNILNVDEFLHDTSIRQYFYHQIKEINDLIKESTEL